MPSDFSPLSSLVSRVEFGPSSKLTPPIHRAGAAQPLMTVVFGALTSAFTGYSAALYAQQRNPSAEGEAAIEAAKAALFVEVNKDVLYLVYIGKTVLYLSVFDSTLTRLVYRYRNV